MKPATINPARNISQLDVLVKKSDYSTPNK